MGFLGEKKNSGVRSPRPNSVSPIPGPKTSSAAARSLPEKKGGYEITGRIGRVIRFQL